VISTCNRAELLRPCLRAVLASRTSASFEVIVVDNASTDETRAVVQEFTREPGPVPVQYVWEPRQGVSYGRNAGIARASAGVIALTDDDIQVSPDWIEQLWRVLHAHPEIDCVGGPILPLWSGEPPSWLDKRHWSPLSVTDHGPDAFEIDARRPVCLLTSNLAVRRAVFDRVGLFSPEFPRSQDHELEVRFWRAGGRALYCPAVVVHTAVPSQRMTLQYHRQWHVRHGRMCARMGLREQIGPDGGLRASLVAPRLIGGVPGFLWRELAAKRKR